MDDCLFCRVVAGEIPSTALYEDDDIYAFEDIDPKAPVHFLVIPKKHYDNAADLTEADGAVLGKIFACIARIADEKGLSGGWRVVANVGKDGGQTVGHLHFHVLGGRGLAWPPG